MKSILLAVTLVIAITPCAAAADFQQAKPPASKTQPAKPNLPAKTAAPGSLSAVQRALERDPDLSRRVAQRLPARIDVMWAASGFRDLPQFVAAVNAADNLQIPFMTLKARILDDGMNLSQAIRDLRRSSDYRKEARRAEDEAKAMMRKR
jgi:hypothetical protein